MNNSANYEMVRHFFPAFNPEVLDKKENFCIEPKEQMMKDFSLIIKKILNKQTVNNQGQKC